MQHTKTVYETDGTGLATVTRIPERRRVGGFPYRVRVCYPDRGDYTGAFLDKADAIRTAQRLADEPRSAPVETIKELDSEAYHRERVRRIVNSDMTDVQKQAELLTSAMFSWTTKPQVD